MKSGRCLLFKFNRTLQVGLTNRHVEWHNVRNAASDPFDFLPDLYPEVYKTLSQFPETKKQSAIIPLLHLAQRQNGGWIPLPAMLKIAEICGVPQKRVFECATFYCMFNHKPVGKYHIQVCVTTPCMIRGADEILHGLCHHLGVAEEEVTPDGLFSVCEMECMGACVHAPMICIADYSNPPNYRYDYIEDLSLEKTIEVVDNLRKGIYPPVGSQLGRKGALPLNGRTSLKEPPPGPFCRDLEKI
jgi:NADH dehydrogenase (ubiquinone) flavoprotein 2